MSRTFQLGRLANPACKQALKSLSRETVKVTIGLSKRSVDFFKKQAQQHHTQYQKMIRRLLDLYVAHHQGRKTG